MCRKSIKKETFTSYETIVTKIVRIVNVPKRQNPLILLGFLTADSGT